MTHDTDEFDPTDIEVELAAMISDPINVPLRVHVKGDYVFITFDHGLGDAHFMNETLALTSGKEAEAIANWPQLSSPLKAASTALRAAVRKHPRRIAGDSAGLARRHLSRDREVEMDRRERSALTPTFVLVSSAPGYSSELRQAGIGAPSSSILSIVVVAAVRAFRKHRIETPAAGVLVDLRRYLPEGAFTLANFVSVVSVATEPAMRPHQLDQHLRSELESYRPIIAHSVWEARQIVPDMGPRGVVHSNHARLMFSEGTGARAAVKKYAWAESLNPPVHTATLPLQFPDQISTLISRTPDGGIHMGASFFREVYEPATVRRALTDVLGDPYAAATG